MRQLAIAAIVVVAFAAIDVSTAFAGFRGI
jgi:hypothetical protein